MSTETALQPPGPHHSEQLNPPLPSCRDNVSQQDLQINFVRHLTVEEERTVNLYHPT